VTHKCKSCSKIIDDFVPLCKDCFFRELMWYYRNNPNVQEDIEYRKKSDGTIEEVEIIKGLAFKKEAFEYIKNKFDTK
jgi:CTP:phosphocholine cytidylyltransferase-like protein